MNFADPLAISAIPESPSKLEVIIHDALAFASGTDSNIENVEITFEKTIPRQMLFSEDDPVIESLQGAYELATPVLKSTEVGIFAMSLFWQAII